MALTSENDFGTMYRGGLRWPGVAPPCGQRSRSAAVGLRRLRLSQVRPCLVRAALRGSGKVSIHESHRCSRDTCRPPRPPQQRMTSGGANRFSPSIRARRLPSRHAYRLALAFRGHVNTPFYCDHRNAIDKEIAERR